MKKIALSLMSLVAASGVFAQEFEDPTDLIQCDGTHCTTISGFRVVDWNNDGFMDIVVKDGNTNLKLVLQKGTIPPPEVSQGLVVHYTFDDNNQLAADSSPSDITGSVQGAVYSPDGRHNGAASFDGSNDYIEIPSSSNVAFGVGDFSISYWVKFTSTHASTVAWPQSGMYKHATGLGSVGDFEIALYNDKSLSVVANVQGDFINTGSAIATQTWYHVTVTRNSGTLKLYVDGQLVGSQTYSTNLNQTKQYLGTSWAASTPERYLHGLLDEFRVYNRLLSTSEICTLAEKPPC